MRDRLNNRNQGGGSRHRPKDNRNRGDHKRGDSRRGPPHSGGLAQGASRSSHKDGGADSRDRDERDLRLQRMMTATQTKGQLISKCPFGVFKSSKKTNEFFPRISALNYKKRPDQKSSVRESKQILKLVV